MTNTKICQSCAMPMTAADHGTNADGTPSADFCKFCMKDGKMGGLHHGADGGYLRRYRPA